MGDVVNLNQYRKLKAKREQAKKAEQNRVKHGLSSSEKKLKERKKAIDDKRLEGHKLPKSVSPSVSDTEDTP
jgi:hypothetical protein